MNIILYNKNRNEKPQIWFAIDMLKTHQTAKL